MTVVIHHLTLLHRTALIGMDVKGRCGVRSLTTLSLYQLNTVGYFIITASLMSFIFLTCFFSIIRYWSKEGKIKKSRERTTFFKATKNTEWLAHSRNDNNIAEAYMSTTY